MAPLLRALSKNYLPSQIKERKRKKGGGKGEKKKYDAH